MANGWPPQVTFGGGCRFDASLRVWHPSLDPRLIASALSMRPQRSCKVGDRRRSPKGRLLPGYEKQSFCSFPVIGGGAAGAEAMTAAEFATAVDRFLDRLSRKAQFMREIRAGGGGADLFVGWFFTIFAVLPLEHGWLGKLGELEIDLNLDTYAS